MKKHRKGRGSGGVVFYFKNRFKSGVHRMPSSIKQCMWVKFDRTLFGLHRDIYICLKGLTAIRKLTFLKVKIFYYFLLIYF